MYSSVSRKLEVRMDVVIEEKDIDLFINPARLIVAGFSGSGKTSLVCRIVRKYHNKFDKIIVCGTNRHPLQEEEDDIARKVFVHKDIVKPTRGDDDDDDDDDDGGGDDIPPGLQRLYILDDIFTEAAQNKYVIDAFTKGRHSRISTILITQNLFFSGKHARNISLNATHYILLRQRDLNQIECLGRQIYGNQRSKDFVSVYKAGLKTSTYGYLLVDLSTVSKPEIQFRTNIAGEPPYEIVFQWRKKGVEL